MDPASVAPRSDAESDHHPPAITTAHLARFEFSDEGTKILMVEWQPEAELDSTGADADGATAAAPHPDAAGAVTSTPEQPQDAPAPEADAGWEVSWPGKSTLLPARDADQDGSKRRVYFLLPEDVSVPPTVTIARRGQSSLVLKPLPAIFPPGFDAEPGSRGVLHTLWAKKRLRELDREMEAEMKTNAESVGLQMAYSEKQWIIETFLTPPTSHMTLPLSPKSPITGRLGEKLKGLRLATSPDDLLPSPTGMPIVQRSIINTNTCSQYVYGSKCSLAHAVPARKRHCRSFFCRHVAQRRRTRRFRGSQKRPGRYRRRPICTAHQPTQPR